MVELKEKKKRLEGILANMGSVLVAFSGGVDSTLLLKVALDVLGYDNVLAVTSISETLPHSDHDDVSRVVALTGVRHISIHTNELSLENFSNNPPNRCFYCKRELFSDLVSIAHKKGFTYVIDGTNYDDQDDYRPGRRAALELGVRSPLLDSGLTKDEVRLWSRSLGLPNWEKPASPCLASRIPYGNQITLEKLQQIEKAEGLLTSKGFHEKRVRHHGEIARIEVPWQELGRLLHVFTDPLFLHSFKEIGFTYVTADLEGLRRGSLNEPLTGSGVLV